MQEKNSVRGAPHVRTFKYKIQCFDVHGDVLRLASILFFFIRAVYPSASRVSQVSFFVNCRGVCAEWFCAKMSGAPRKRKVLSLELKAKMIQEVADGEKKKKVAERYDVPLSTLSTILKAKNTIICAVNSSDRSTERKRVKAATYVDVEKAVFTWFMEMRAKNIPMSGAVLQQKALAFACMLGCHDFKASSGWLQRFKERHNIVGKVVSGESAEANAVGAADWLRDRVPGIVAQYDSASIYNADETALFYRLLPKRTLALKNERCHGGKQSKQRLTVLLCANMDGSDKRKPLVIGTSGRPRCFKGKTMPVKYVSNTKAWMTRAIFSDWLKELDKEMGQQSRKICLLLDNCSAHHVDVQLSNVELEYFPAHCTSLIQPLDQGVINSVKCSYRKRIIQRVLLNMQHKRDTKIDVFMAIEMLSASWQSTNKDIVVNCFKKAGIVAVAAGDPSDAECDDEVDVRELQSDVAEAWQQLCEGGGVPEDVSLGDFISSDECVVATEELDDGAIIESVQGKSVTEDDADTDQETEESVKAPATTEVLNAIDILRRHAGVHEHEPALVAIATYERHITPTLVSKRQAKITDFMIAP